MRKRLISPTPERVRPHDESWIDLDGAAMVEVTSEEEHYPIESALLSRETRGWRASRPGAQTVRLVFDEPQRLKRIALFSRKTIHDGPKNSSCDGRQTSAVEFQPT